MHGRGGRREKRSEPKAEAKSEKKRKTKKATSAKGRSTATGSYQQNWPLYNSTQTHEKERFRGYLFELGQTLGEAAPPRGRGRPRHPLADVIFSLIYKVYEGESGRSLMPDVGDALAKDFPTVKPSYNSPSDYLTKAELTPVLYKLIDTSTSPFVPVEQTVAIDSTGFNTDNLIRTPEASTRSQEVWRDWMKAQFAVGVRTHVITAVKVTSRHAHDGPQLQWLQRTRENGFEVEGVTADKAYSTYKSLQSVEAIGATPCIAFKDNAPASGHFPLSGRGEVRC